MRTRMRAAPVYPAALTLVALSLSAPMSWADDDDDEIEFDVARLFFQLNDTDGDLGLHLLVDGEPWKTLEIENQRERRLLRVNTQGGLRRQGLTEFKFESAEPGFDDFPPERFFDRFREGEYEIDGEANDGIEYGNTVVISHLMPAAPGGLQVNGVDTPDDCEEDDPPLVMQPITLSWDAVTSSHAEIGTPGEVPIGIVRYEVAVERDEPVPLKVEASIHVDGGAPVTSFAVPAGLLLGGDEVKFQILVEAENGNETSSESCFEVM